MGNQIQKTQQDEKHQGVSLWGKKFKKCEICFESMVPIKKFQHMYSNRCVHPFCTDCMIKYIQVKLEDNVSDIKCPKTTCNYSLDPLSWRHKIAPKLFDKWCDLLCKSMVLAFDGVYCPNSQCSELILNECGNKKLKRSGWVCPACRRPFCFRCKVPWHFGYLCEESSEKRDENDVAFGEVSARNGWKRCPKCRHCVERAYGCYTMTCRCGVTFCYRCGKRISTIKLIFYGDLGSCFCI